MIPKAAVDQYAGRALDSHLWIKGLSKAELWDTVYELRPRPKLYPKLHKHQLTCFLLGVSYPKFAFWLDMGTGKSLITLELLQYWWQCKKLRRALIFVKSDKAFPTWEKQLKRFKIDLPYIVLEGSSEEKWAALTEFGNGLVFVTYPGAVAMATVPRALKKGKKPKKKTKVDNALVAALSDRVDAIAMDESTRASGHTSLTFDLMDRIKADIRYGLAGRPFGRDPTMLWAQHYLIDRGETLGPTLGMFREAFFTAQENPWVAVKRRKYIKEYTFDKRKQGRLAEMIQHRSITYEESECGDVPQWVPIQEEVNFPEEAGAYYQRAVKTIIEAQGNIEEIKNVFLRMRQLSSGFMGFKSDETGEKAQIEFAENPKFDRLMECLDEMPQDRKGVVFYDFTHSGRKIFEATKAFRPVWIWSGTKDYRADLKRFEEGDSQLAIINHRIGAYSLDGLQVANYCFIFESPVSVIDREQLEKRLRRQGQTRKVFQYDFIVRNSMDQRILDFHVEGADLMQALLRNPKLVQA